jgi:hypothetical protein
VLTNAGQGPIPAWVLTHREQADQAEELIGELPERGECHLLVSMPRPDDFVAFARRGFFAYDWGDIQRTRARTFRYELVAQPKSPVSVEELPPGIASLARGVRFGTLQFADSPSVAVSEHLVHPSS